MIHVRVAFVVRKWLVEFVFFCREYGRYLKVPHRVIYARGDGEYKPYSLAVEV